MVIDENKVKIYDQNGKPIKTVGRRGQGPGEFNYVGSILVSPEGFYCVYGSREAHLFKPDNSFIKKFGFEQNYQFKDILKQNNMFMDYDLNKIFIQNEKSTLYLINAQSIDRNNPQKEIYLFYEIPETTLTIARYPRTSYIPYPDVPYPGNEVELLGSIQCALLPENRIVYLHSWIDTKKDKESSQYILTVLSLKTMKKSQIIHPYIIQEVPKGVWDLRGFTDQDMINRVNKNREVYRKFIEERKYSSALSKILTDRDYIFAFTYQKKDSLTVLTDVFDSRTGEYTASVYIPYNICVIKNGFAYKINDFSRTKTFPLVEKYKINPAVYETKR
jgi:hypothetical protein